MIDLHAHILPGIDDGAKDMCMSAEMLEIAARDGITDMIVTPHFIHGDIDNTADKIKQQLVQLAAEAEHRNISVSLYPGSEVFICPEVPALLQEGKIQTLNDSRYVLIELPMAMVPEYTEDVLYEVRLLGYTPVIAHPERNMMMGRKPGILKELVEQGALAQVNATSITGLYGKRIERIAMKMIANGWVHFVCSDAHSCRGRAPILSRARERISRKYGKEKADRLFEANGRSVLSNSEIQGWENTKTSGRHWIWFPGLKRLLES